MEEGEESGRIGSTKLAPESPETGTNLTFFGLNPMLMRKFPTSSLICWYLS